MKKIVFMCDERVKCITMTFVAIDRNAGNNACVGMSGIDTRTIATEGTASYDVIIDGAVGKDGNVIVKQRNNTEGL